MTCDEFSKRLSDFCDWQQSRSTPGGAILDHAASCSLCQTRLESERALKAGLHLLATDELKIEAPAAVRSALLTAFEYQTTSASSSVVQFPGRSNWTRWTLAAAASIVLGFVLIFAFWAPNPDMVETASGVVPAVPIEFSESGLDPADRTRSINEAPRAVLADSRLKGVRRARSNRRQTPGSAYNIGTQVASTEVKSEFMPLTYLNDATAMDTGIVIRVEIAREQLATLGLPFDMQRADDIIKADIVVGDDGVARAIRLVQ